jgi:DNA invertase Pin-like site-specific DNA recombinase
MMLERQAEGIEKAKQEGKYKGRKATARAKATDVNGNRKLTHLTGSLEIEN